MAKNELSAFYMHLPLVKTNIAFLYGSHNICIMVGCDGYFNPYGYMTRAELITAVDDMNNIDNMIVAAYLGVESYGEPETNKSNKDSFKYRFEIDGKEVILSVDNGISLSRGCSSSTWPYQRVLSAMIKPPLRMRGKIIW